MKTGVLFLCAGNSIRSQMAEGLARMLYGNDVSVQSAGNHSGIVHRHAISVMAEIGVDLTSHRAKSAQRIDAASVHTVITLCAEAVCPTFLSKARRLHWPIANPTDEPMLPREEMLARFRNVRDYIRQKLENAPELFTAPNDAQRKKE